MGLMPSFCTNSATTGRASLSPQIRTSQLIVAFTSRSRWAEMFWSAQTTCTPSPRICLASSVAEPASGMTTRRALSGSSGTDTSTKILPCTCSRTVSSVLTCAE